MKYLREGGVCPGPFGSLVREKYGIDNSNPGALYSLPGQEALRSVLSEYNQAGATFVSAPTFRLTDLRPGDNDENWDFEPGAKFGLSSSMDIRIQKAVRLARIVHSDRIVGLVSPLGDTSGKHDERWRLLGPNKVDWAMQRHRPQIEALLRRGVPAIWGEAFRYHEEAIAVARLAKQLGAMALTICFEANEKGVPDPESGKSFIDTKEDLKKEAGSGIDVFVGANCTGIKNIRWIWQRKDHIDAAYPNSLNFSDTQKEEFATLVENPSPTEADKLRIAEMQAYYATSLQEWVKFFREAFSNQGVLIAGGCCGTTPEHTWVARQAFNEATMNRLIDKELGPRLPQ